MSAEVVRRRARRARTRRLAAALIALALLAAIAFVAFWRGALSGGYEIEAVVGTANQLRPGAAVRVAGLDVGRLEAIEPGPGASSRLRLRIDDDAPPIHDDAGVRIAPRLFFEGNAAIRIAPGTAGRPPIRPGATIPRSRTSVAVQLDQVLDVLTTPVRDGLRRTAAELDRGFGGPAGRSGADGLRRATRELDGALADVTTVERAVRGVRPGDLEGAIAGTADSAEQLVRDPAALQGVVTNSARLLAALADRERQLGASVDGLLAVLGDAPATLRRLDLALPVVDRFAGALRPALAAAPRPLRRTAEALEQVRAITAPGELPATLDALRPITADLPPLAERLTGTLPLLTDAMRCVDRNVLPTLRMQVPDGKLSTGRPVWQDALHMGAALAGASPNFDGNGTTIRLGVTEGEQALEGVLPGIGTVSTLAADGVGSLSPAWLGYGVSPPFRPDVRCTTQTLPDLDARSSARLQGFRRTAATPAKEARAQQRVASRTLLSRPPLGGRGAR